MLAYPDVSNWQAGMSLRGIAAVCVKATEGMDYTDPSYASFRDQASAEEAEWFAYHLLHGGAPRSQAAHCLAVTGGRPLMVDIEPVISAGSHPSIADAAAFIDAYRHGGGICHLAYLPRWYWAELGSPHLGSLIRRRMTLVSSSYPADGYSPHGPGWQAYGGMTPGIWQWTNSGLVNGEHVDLNAWRGSLAQLARLIRTGRTHATGKPWEGLMLTLTRPDDGDGITVICLPSTATGIRFGSDNPASITVDWHGAATAKADLTWAKGSVFLPAPHGVRMARVKRDDDGWQHLRNDIAFCVE